MEKSSSESIGPRPAADIVGAIIRADLEASYDGIYDLCTLHDLMFPVFPGLAYEVAERLAAEDSTDLRERAAYYLASESLDDPRVPRLWATLLQDPDPHIRSEAGIKLDLKRVLDGLGPASL